MPDTVFLKRCLTILAIAVAAFVVWRLRQVELLAFGAVLMAMLFRTAQRAIETRLRLPRPWSLVVALAAIVAIVAGALAFAFFKLQAEVLDLSRRLPADLAQMKRTLGGSPFGSLVDQAIDQFRGGSNLLDLGQIKGYVTSAGTGVLDIVLVVAAGIYLAAQPAWYRTGLMRLVPQSAEAPLVAWLEACVRLLRRWILAQLCAMISIGVLAGAGLTGIGVPSSGALGLFAGLAEFIPLVGPILGALPALVVAFATSSVMAAEVAALFIGIHLVEANLLQPFLQRRFASLPPVVSIFALLVFGAFFGLLGVVLAAPLAIVALVAVRVLYLGDDLTAQDPAKRP